MGEEKKIALSIRVKPIDLEVMDSDELKSKAQELFEILVRLETDKYDYEQRSISQDYELRELKERQKVQLRQRAIKKGLDPEAFTGKHPPKIRMYSKSERRTWRTAGGTSTRSGTREPSQNCQSGLARDPAGRLGNLTLQIVRRNMWTIIVMKKKSLMMRRNM